MDKDNHLATEGEQRPCKIITTPIDMKQLLDRVALHHTIVKIGIDHSPEILGSMLLRIDGEKKLVVIDGVIPFIGNALLPRVKHAKFMTLVDGIDLHFTMAYLQSIGSDREIKHIFRFPEEMRYFQLRNFHRVVLAPSQVVTIVLRPSPQNQITCRLVDISLGGIAVLLDVQPPRSFAVGEKIAECEIQLNAAESFVCAVMIRYMGQEKGNRKFRLGLEFANLGTVQQRMVERYVANIERQSRRIAAED